MVHLSSGTHFLSHSVLRMVIMSVIYFHLYREARNPTTPSNSLQTRSQRISVKVLNRNVLFCGNNGNQCGIQTETFTRLALFYMSDTWASTFVFFLLTSLMSPTGDL